MKQQNIIAGLVILLASSQAFAGQTYVCKNGNGERKVEVASTDASKPAPCEVKYFKEGDTAGKVLWNAQNDAQYCEAKAKEFTDKLGTMGWNCASAEAVAATKTEAPATTAAPAAPAAEPAKK